MKTAISATIALTLWLAGQVLKGQETQGMSWVDANGTRTTLNLQTGYTAIDKNGKVTHSSPSELNGLCGEMDKQDHLSGPTLRSLALLCEQWQEWQPKTQIERVPFSTLIARLLVVTAPSTDFARYRGLKLKSDSDSDTYDAIIVPEGLGENVSCSIVQSHNPLGLKEYRYTCSIKTGSYSAAVELQNTLVLNLNRLGLAEDHVKEHGLAANDKANNDCAPTGECAHAHVYVSVLTDGKLLSIEAEPTFIRNGLSDIRTELATGHHSFAEGIAPNSGTVEFSVLSFRPD